MEFIEIFERKNLESFYTSYLENVNFFLTKFEVEGQKIPDHLGCTVHSSKEFNLVSSVLSKFSTAIKSIELHGRRVRIFKFDTPLLGTMLMPKIEIFEPKVDDDLKKLRYGIEHIGFMVSDWEDFTQRNKGKWPVAKEGMVNNSKFIKTEIVNMVEIEFRNDRLGEEEE